MLFPVLHSVMSMKSEKVVYLIRAVFIDLFNDVMSLGSLHCHLSADVIVMGD